MPTAASNSAMPAKAASKTKLKSLRAVDCFTTSSMETTRPTANPPLAILSSR
jgi:hypothetical protein